MNRSCGAFFQPDRGVKRCKNMSMRSALPLQKVPRYSDRSAKLESPYWVNMWNTLYPQQNSSVVVFEADHEASSALEMYLSRFSMRVSIVVNATQLFTALQHHQIDLILVDWTSQAMDVLALVRRIRQQFGVPLIILADQDTSVDRILGLEAGADDYVGKPFEPRELVARIRAVLRRGQEAAISTRSIANADTVCFDGWELHRDARKVVSPVGLSIPLSNAEFRLLTTFLHAPRRICSRDQLIEKARGRDMEAFERSIDLLVSRLRHKLANDAAKSSIIKTVRGAGYMFDVQSVRWSESTNVNANGADLGFRL